MAGVSELEGVRWGFIDHLLDGMECGGRWVRLQGRVSGSGKQIAHVPRNGAAQESNLPAASKSPAVGVAGSVIRGSMTVETPI
jgi:hypothetical protein